MSSLSSAAASPRDEPRPRSGGTLDAFLEAFASRLDAEQSRAFRIKMTELDARRRRLH